MGGTADIATRPWTRLVLVIGAGLATAVAVAAVAVLAGTDDPDDDGPSAYDLEVVLGDEQPLAALWSTAINGHGAVAAAAAPASRPRSSKEPGAPPGSPPRTRPTSPVGARR